jgi:hypothetical protein
MRHDVEVSEPYGDVLAADESRADRVECPDGALLPAQLAADRQAAEHQPLQHRPNEIAVGAHHRVLVDQRLEQGDGGFGIGVFSEVVVELHQQTPVAGQRLDGGAAACGGAGEHHTDGHAGERVDQRLGLPAASAAEWAQVVGAGPPRGVSRFGVADQVDAHGLVTLAAEIGGPGVERIVAPLVVKRATGAVSRLGGQGELHPRQGSIFRPSHRLLQRTRLAAARPPQVLVVRAVL